MSIYDFKVKTATALDYDLNQCRDKVLLIVNTASECRFTTQYRDLQRLYDRYKDRGLEIIGFPCNQFGEQEPGTNTEIQSFCQLNYGVEFQVLEKVEVRGPHAHPLFRYLIQQAPYQGFDTKQMQARILHKFLEEKFPEFLPGDSIKWNFTKFLIGRDGKVLNRFEPPLTLWILNPT